MKTANSNSIVGVMNLFSTEEYYKYAMEVLWTLRQVVLDKVEYTDNQGRFGWNRNHPDFWIANITNEVIGRSLIDDYNFSSISGRHWYISKHREDGTNFLTEKEAKFIASIANDDDLMRDLYRLKAVSENAVNDKNNQAHHVYTVVSDLLEMLVGHELLIA